MYVEGGREEHLLSLLSLLDSLLQSNFNGVIIIGGVCCPKMNFNISKYQYVPTSISSTVPSPPTPD